MVGHCPQMSESDRMTSGSWWRTVLLRRVAILQRREDQVFLVLALLIGALTGLAVVAFIVLTERLGMRLYPVGGAPWRRVLFPVVGSLGIGYLLFRYFPDARGSGYRRPRLRFTPVKVASLSAPCSESSFARRQHSPVESRWGARGLLSRWVRALLQCSGGAWD